MPTDIIATVPYVFHEKLIEDNKADYYIALRRSQQTMGDDREDISPWINFFLGIILKQSQKAVELLSGEAIDKLLSAKQRAVLTYVTQVTEASPREIVQATDIAQATVRQALDKLLKHKKIERQGQGKGYGVLVAFLLSMRIFILI